MTAFMSHTTIDCRNSFELSERGQQLLGCVDLPDDPNEPGHEFCILRSQAELPAGS